MMNNCISSFYKFAEIFDGGIIFLNFFILTKTRQHNPLRHAS